MPFGGVAQFRDVSHMNRTFAHILAVGLLTILCACSSPEAVITNSSSEPVSVEIHTDVGESYNLSVPANKSARLNISGKDKELWIVATFTDGRKLESKKLYVTTQGKITSTITNGQVDIGYEL